MKELISCCSSAEVGSLSTFRLSSALQHMVCFMAQKKTITSMDMLPVQVQAKERLTVYGGSTPNHSFLQKYLTAGFDGSTLAFWPPETEKQCQECSHYEFMIKHRKNSCSTQLSAKLQLELNVSHSKVSTKLRYLFWDGGSTSLF